MVLLQEIIFKRDEILIGVLIISLTALYLLNRKLFSNFPHRKYFEISIFSFIFSKILTIVENFFWGEFLHIVEHIFLLIYTIFLTIWIIKLYFNKERVEEKSTL